jgi:preprotein translocase subunit SecD
MNQYPLWKYILVGGILFICTLFALPNLFGEDPAVQISPVYGRDIKLDSTFQSSVEAKLKDANLTASRIDMTPDQLLVRFSDTETQLKAYSILKESLHGYVVAQNLASATPRWLTALGAQPMYLGLDLRGGVHFLMQVDMETAIKQDEEQLVEDLRTVLREKKLHYKGLNRLAEATGGVRVSFADVATRDQARPIVAKEYPDLVIKDRDTVDDFGLYLTFNEKNLVERRKKALEQNITTLRNRVNELGVAEPIIQQQGQDRIVVQLPGVQDTARAKEILGATATLEFRLVDGTPDQWQDAQRNNKIPVNSRLYKQRDGSPILLKRSVIVTGDQINDAASALDQRSGRPSVSVVLDNKGAKRMNDTTRENIQKPMSVVFIEYRSDKQIVDGKEVKTRKKVEEVINVATIQEQFGKNFQITGLTSGEARNLSLLLRAGALKAPMEIVEERTIGPSLGKENIRQGFLSALVGFVVVMIFMVMRYSTFGMVANIALFTNMIILISLLSMLQATLTLPGIAGIVLTMGMAVDANVLIYERIREELHIGNSPQASIHAGFEKAFSTIADSNVTTMIAGIVLFSFGTGPIKGFAVTLSLGILSSMFTAIMVSRAVINYKWGGKRLTSLPV